MTEGIFKGQKCEFCGKQAENFLFAAFVCSSDDCIDKAREVRGGPGGHIKEKYRRKDRSSMSKLLLCFPTIMRL